MAPLNPNPAAVPGTSADPPWNLIEVASWTHSSVCWKKTVARFIAAWTRGC